MVFIEKQTRYLQTLERIYNLMKSWYILKTKTFVQKTLSPFWMSNCPSVKDGVWIRFRGWSKILKSFAIENFNITTICFKEFLRSISYLSSSFSKELEIR